MTKTVLLFVALVLAASAVQAHGAPEARELDTRLLFDDDGAVGMGGCTELGCTPGMEPAAFDLLALDVREAALTDGTPVVWFRIVVQTETETLAGRTISLSLSTPGGPMSFTLTGDGQNFTSADVDLLMGPSPVGDGHPFAIDAGLKSSTLGAAVGDTLTDIAVESLDTDDNGDLMPGTWQTAGVAVPRIPDEVGLPEDAEPASYTLAGPAMLLEVTPAITTGTGNLTVRNTLAGIDQFVTVGVAGVTASAEPGTLLLKGGETRTIRLRSQTADAVQDGTVTLTSDLGAYQQVAFQVPTRPAPTTATPTDTPDPSETPSEDSPIGWVVAPLAVAVALAARRRVP